jgi:hypothetical protein
MDQSKDRKQNDDDYVDEDDDTDGDVVLKFFIFSTFLKNLYLSVCVILS